MVKKLRPNETIEHKIGIHSSALNTSCHTHTHPPNCMCAIFCCAKHFSFTRCRYFYCYLIHILILFICCWCSMYVMNVCSQQHPTASIYSFDSYVNVFLFFLLFSFQLPSTFWLCDDSGKYVHISIHISLSQCKVSMIPCEMCVAHTFIHMCTFYGKKSDRKKLFLFM